MITRFDQLIDAAKQSEPCKVIILGPSSAPSLACALRAQEKGIARCTLIGNLQEIRTLADSHEIDLSPLSLIDEPTQQEAIEQAIHLCRKEQGDLLIHDTAALRAFLPAVLDRETGLCTGGWLTGVSVLETKEFRRLLLVSDTLMIVSPGLEQRISIIEQAIEVAHRLGVSLPHVALIAATETISPKNPFSVEAAQMTVMSRRNQIKGAVIDGPLGFDNAISARAAEVKGISSEVSGEVDILIAPDLEAGNLLVKTLNALCKIPVLDIVVGGKVPLVCWSPTDDVQTRLAALGLGVLCS